MSHKCTIFVLKVLNLFGKNPDRFWVVGDW